MATKRLNPRLSKIHRSYTVEEVAKLYGVHKKTVRNWIKNGLPVFNEVRPLLILGTDLRLFLQQKRDKSRSQCKEGEMYCLKCRAPRKPNTEAVKFIQSEHGIGRMFARCSRCGSKVNKFYSLRQLESLRREFNMENAVGTKTHNYESLSSLKLSLT